MVPLSMKFSFHTQVFFVLFLFHFSSIGMCLAQETINYASVRGRITDPTGAVVSGAPVSARQMDTNLTSTTTTDQEGRFRFPYLRPGPYQITVRELGFADAIRAVTLTL